MQRATGCAGVFDLVIGTDAEVGEALIADRRMPLISATGSLPHGARTSGEVVAERARPHAARARRQQRDHRASTTPTWTWRCARIAVRRGRHGGPALHDDAAAVRCTKAIAPQFIERLLEAYESGARSAIRSRTARSWARSIDEDAVQRLRARGRDAIAQRAATILYGGKRARRGPGYFVEPTLVRAHDARWRSPQEETFAPILYVFEIDDLDEAIAHHNDVAAGPLRRRSSPRPPRRGDVPVAARAATAASPT